MIIFFVSFPVCLNTTNINNEKNEGASKVNQSVIASKAKQSVTSNYQQITFPLWRDSSLVMTDIMTFETSTC